MSARSRGRPRTFRDALTFTADSIQGREVTLHELIDLIGEQGLLFLCAALTVPFLLPVSIPGVSTVFGAAIILISIGITIDRPPWLPKRITERPLDAERLVPVLRKGADIVARIEAYIRPRLPGLADLKRVNGLALIFGGVLLMFPLGLVPFSNTCPGLAILLLAIGMSQRDGLLVLAGYGMLLVTVVYFAALGYAAVIAGQGLASLLG